MRKPKESRRAFMEDIALGIAAMGVGLPLLNKSSTAAPSGAMPYRTLGRTGEKVSLLGLGGAHLRRMSDEDSIRLVRTAIDNGVNFVENSWDYGSGVCEYRMGKALQDGYRKKVFLATKVNGRTKDYAAWQLDESLRRLRTDTVDLMQFHELSHMDDPDKIFGPNGAVEALEAAKKAGKFRYVGFTSHVGPDVILKTLDVASKRGFTFDTVMVTFNVMDPHFRDCVGKVLPVLAEQGMGILAFKTMCGGTIVREGVLEQLKMTPAECLQYVMNLPISVLISGMGNLEQLKANIETARNFRPLSEAEVASLLAKTAEAGATGNHEWFKGPRGLEKSRTDPSFS